MTTSTLVSSITPLGGMCFRSLDGFKRFFRICGTQVLRERPTTLFIAELKGQYSCSLDLAEDLLRIKRAFALCLARTMLGCSPVSPSDTDWRRKRIFFS